MQAARGTLRVIALLLAFLGLPTGLVIEADRRFAPERDQPEHAGKVLVALMNDDNAIAAAHRPAVAGGTFNRLCREGAVRASSCRRSAANGFVE